MDNAKGIEFKQRRVQERAEVHGEQKSFWGLFPGQRGNIYSRNKYAQKQ
jgi:hypothetical protein